MNKYTEKVITLAEDLTGCPDVAAFETSIDFISEVVERSILNNINQAEVPVGLERVVIYRTLGELIKIQGKIFLGMSMIWRNQSKLAIRKSSLTASLCPCV